MTSTPLHFAPTALLGPEYQGRGYRLLRHTLSDQDRDMRVYLEHLALLLAYWADERPQPTAFFTPLGSGDAYWVLCRFTFLGEGGLGTVAFGNVVLLSRAYLDASGWNAHHILEQVPGSDAELLGEEPFRIEPIVAGRGNPRSAAAVQWGRSAVETTEPELALVRLLDGFSPPEQRVNFGWSTTGLLPSAGAFDPGAAFRLIVHRPGEGPAGGPWTSPETFDGAAPASWTSWRAVQQALAVDPKSVAWRSDYEDLPVEVVLEDLLIRVCAPLMSEERATFLDAAFQAGRSSEPWASDLRQAALAAVGRIIKLARDPDEAAYHLAMALRQNSKDDLLLKRLVSLVLTRGVLVRMDSASRGLLIQGGLFDLLAEAGEQWAEMDPDLPALAGLLDSAVAAAFLEDLGSPAARVAALLIQKTARPSPKLARSALATFLTAGGDALHERLADLDVADLAPDGPGHASSRKAYADMALRPGLKNNRPWSAAFVRAFVAGAHAGAKGLTR